MNVLLIGPRGCGKSSVGVLLAGRLEIPFRDLDDIVLGSFEQASVSEVWAMCGESAWREAEVSSLKESLGEASSVIALGGGVPMIEDARTLINLAREAGEAVVIYLRCEPDELRRRLIKDSGDRPGGGRTGGDRPGLTGADPIAEIDDVLAQRHPTYARMADHVFDVSAATVEKTAEQLADWIRTL